MRLVNQPSFHPIVKRLLEDPLLTIARMCPNSVVGLTSTKSRASDTLGVVQPSSGAIHMGVRAVSLRTRAAIGTAGSLGSTLADNEKVAINSHEAREVESGARGGWCESEIDAMGEMKRQPTSLQPSLITIDKDTFRERSLQLLTESHNLAAAFLRNCEASPYLQPTLEMVFHEALERSIAVFSSNSKSMTLPNQGGRSMQLGGSPHGGQMSASVKVAGGGTGLPNISTATSPFSLVASIFGFGRVTSPNALIGHPSRSVDSSTDQPHSSYSNRDDDALSLSRLTSVATSHTGIGGVGAHRRSVGALPMSQSQAGHSGHSADIVNPPSPSSASVHRCALGAQPSPTDPNSVSSVTSSIPFSVTADLCQPALDEGVSLSQRSLSPQFTAADVLKGCCQDSPQFRTLWQVLQLLKHFSFCLPDVLIAGIRKTDSLASPLLVFPLANLHPSDLFNDCLSRGKLQTASQYLVILQNIVGPLSVRLDYVLPLFSAALQAGPFEYNLARSLATFFKALYVPTSRTTSFSGASHSHTIHPHQSQSQLTPTQRGSTRPQPRTQPTSLTQNERERKSGDNSVLSEFDSEASKWSDLVGERGGWPHLNHTSADSPVYRMEQKVEQDGSLPPITQSQRTGTAMGGATGIPPAPPIQASVGLPVTPPMTPPSPTRRISESKNTGSESGGKGTAQSNPPINAFQPTVNLWAPVTFLFHHSGSQTSHESTTVGGEVSSYSTTASSVSRSPRSSVTTSAFTSQTLPAPLNSFPSSTPPTETQSELRAPCVLAADSDGVDRTAAAYGYVELERLVAQSVLECIHSFSWLRLFCLASSLRLDLVAWLSPTTHRDVIANLVGVPVWVPVPLPGQQSETHKTGHRYIGPVERVVIAPPKDSLPSLPLSGVESLSHPLPLGADRRFAPASHTSSNSAGPGTPQPFAQLCFTAAESSVIGEDSFDNIGGGYWWVSNTIIQRFEFVVMSLRKHLMCRESVMFNLLDQPDILSTSRKLKAWWSSTIPAHIYDHIRPGGPVSGTTLKPTPPRSLTIPAARLFPRSPGLLPGVLTGGGDSGGGGVGASFKRVQAKFSGGNSVLKLGRIMGSSSVTSSPQHLSPQSTSLYKSPTSPPARPTGPSTTPPDRPASPSFKARSAPPSHPHHPVHHQPLTTNGTPESLSSDTQPTAHTRSVTAEEQPTGETAPPQPPSATSTERINTGNFNGVEFGTEVNGGNSGGTNMSEGGGGGGGIFSFITGWGRRGGQVQGGSQKSSERNKSPSQHPNSPISTHVGEPTDGDEAQNIQLIISSEELQEARLRHKQRWMWLLEARSLKKIAGSRAAHPGETHSSPSKAFPSNWFWPSSPGGGVRPPILSSPSSSPNSSSPVSPSQSHLHYQHIQQHSGAILGYLFRVAIAVDCPLFAAAVCVAARDAVAFEALSCWRPEVNALLRVSIRSLDHVTHPNQIKLNGISRSRRSSQYGAHIGNQSYVDGGST
eukprot:GHVN01072879.1.p1 GENE.GHVN01072879.1~~GHVN01072879.1.p1  ORF type:complete len:1693 (+),score=397.06 GHVN01072879.1:666-5081(+)